MELCWAINQRLCLFLCACISGILFALVWRKYEQTVHLSLIHNHYSTALRDTNYKAWLTKQGKSIETLPEEEVIYGTSSKKDDRVKESAYLYKNVPVLCLIFVKSLKTADVVKQTWSKHCNIVTFFGNFVNDKIPVLQIPTSSSFQGFCYAFIQVWNKYRDHFKWVIIVDDATYTLVENLRYYVAPLNSSMNYYLGHPAQDFGNIYNEGKAGIVLSHGSMSLLSSMYKSAQDCKSGHSPSWYFDEALGKILASFDVHPVDTRDPYLRGRFNPFSMEKMIIPGSISVFSSYWRKSVYLSDEGINCCSDNAITFHGISPGKMYLVEYVLHHLSVFRNSLKGLGNHPPAITVTQTPKGDSKIQQTGEPFIKLIEQNKIHKVRIKKAMAKDDSMLNDIFSS